MDYNVKNLMKEYFSIDNRDLLGNNCPVVPSRKTWEVLESPERLQKKFKFESRRHTIDFLNEVLVIEDNMGHHGNITVDHSEVTISVYTKNINAITNLDREYAETVDRIFRDVQDYRYK